MHPGDNIAIRTGREGGLTVIDVDVRNGGFQTLAAHERERRVLPFDAHYETPSGGFHAMFEYCPELPTGSNRLGPGIDIVNDGAGTPVPPSVRSDGRYTWKTWPGDGAFPAVPDWVIEHVKADAAKREAARAQNTVEIDHAKVSERERRRYEGTAQSLLARLVDQLKHKAKPGRGCDLFTYSGFIAPYIRGGFIKEDEVRAELEGACKANGLTAENGLRDIRATMAAAFARSTSQLPDLSKLGDRPYRSAA
jgi:hypothetical protein